MKCRSKSPATLFAVLCLLRSTSAADNCTKADDETSLMQMKHAVRHGDAKDSNDLADFGNRALDEAEESWTSPCPNCKGKPCRVSGNEYWYCSIARKTWCKVERSCTENSGGQTPTLFFHCDQTDANKGTTPKAGTNQFYKIGSRGAVAADLKRVGMQAAKPKEGTCNPEIMTKPKAPDTKPQSAPTRSTASASSKAAAVAKAAADAKAEADAKAAADAKVAADAKKAADKATADAKTAADAKAKADATAKADAKAKADAAKLAADKATADKAAAAAKATADAKAKADAAEKAAAAKLAVDKATAEKAAAAAAKATADAKAQADAKAKADKVVKPAAAKPQSGKQAAGKETKAVASCPGVKKVHVSHSIKTVAGGDGEKAAKHLVAVVTITLSTGTVLTKTITVPNLTGCMETPAKACYPSHYTLHITIHCNGGGGQKAEDKPETIEGTPDSAVIDDENKPFDVGEAKVAISQHIIGVRGTGTYGRHLQIEVHATLKGNEQVKSVDVPNPKGPTDSGIASRYAIAVTVNGKKQTYEGVVTVKDDAKKVTPSGPAANSAPSKTKCTGQCWQAKPSEHGPGATHHCTDYADAGYEGTADQVAACDPRGDPSECAVMGAPGSSPDKATGLCKGGSAKKVHKYVKPKAEVIHRKRATAKTFTKNVDAITCDNKKGFKKGKVTKEDCEAGCAEDDACHGYVFYKDNPVKMKGDATTCFVCQSMDLRASTTSIGKELFLEAGCKVNAKKIECPS